MIKRKPEDIAVYTWVGPDDGVPPEDGIEMVLGANSLAKKTPMPVRLALTVAIG